LRELEELAAEEERKLREEEEKAAEKERILRLEAENVWLAEMEKRQIDEALMEHEKRLFDSANAAAESEFFRQSILAQDLERDRIAREKGRCYVLSCVVGGCIWTGGEFSFVCVCRCVCL
jgi:hypothetical protein